MFRKPKTKKRSYSSRGTYGGRGIYTGKGLYTGRGNYRKKVAKFAGRYGGAIMPASAVASTAARYTGNPMLASAINSYAPSAKRAAGIIAGKYKGRGSYASSTESNILLKGSTTSSGVPSFTSLGDETGSLVITHTEYISDVFGLPSGVEFQNTSYNLNPGLNRMFPFLSQIAANFEEYEFVQMVVSYKPKLNPNITTLTGQLGSVILFTDYNPDDPKKDSKQQLIQGYGNTNGRVTDELLHFIECDPAKLKGDGHRFVRVRPPFTGSGRLMDYDHGKFQVAVSGTPSSLDNQSLGELYVSYAVKLLKPRIYTLYGLGLDTDYYQTKQNGTFLGSTTNSINLELSKIDDVYHFVFPSNVSGHFKLDVIAEYGGNYFTEAPHKVPTLVGQVTPAYLLQYFNQRVRWNMTSVLLSASGQPDGPTRHTVKLECTVRIEQAIGGEDNSINWGANIGVNQITGIMNVKCTRVNEFELASKTVTYSDIETGELIVSEKDDSN